MRFQISFVAVCALLCAFAVPAGAADTDAGLRKALKRDLTTYLSARGAVEHISAASLSVHLPGTAAYINVTAGTSTFGGKSPVSPSALFEIGSNTKAFTSAALLQLEAEGKLDIDQTVGRWLPQYPAWKNVTIRRLLDMTSGIPTYDDQSAMMKAWTATPGKVWRPEELIAFVYPRNGRGPKPTTGWSYSNTNYLLAQLIVERASGHSYTYEIRSRFLDNPKLGLADSYYSSSTYSEEILGRMVAGYFYNNDPGNADLHPFYDKDVTRLNLSWAQGAGGIIATPEDVARWSPLLYRGDLLGPAQRKELLTIVSVKTGRPIEATSLADPRGFGLGVGQLTIRGMGTFWYYQGETLGYRMVYAYLPKSGAVFAVGLNSQPSGAQDQVGKLLQNVYTTLHAAGKL